MSGSASPFPVAPSERVRHHLDQLSRSLQIKPGTRLPTCQELARELEVSPGTVKNVYRSLAQEGRVRSQVGVGSFWVGTPESAAPRLCRIGITVSTLEKERWTTREGWADRILSGLFQRCEAEEPDVRLEACGRLLPDGTLEDPTPLEYLDGLITLCLYPRPFTFRDPQGRLVPHARLNPNGTANQTNFVSPDYFHSARTLGTTWRTTGRKRVLFLSSHGLHSSPSAQLRFSGLACGIAEAIGRSVELRTLLCNGGSTDDAVTTLSALLETGWAPDAVFTAGIHLAEGAVEAFQAAGLNVPHDVSIVSGSPSVGTCAGLQPTATAHPLEEVGHHLYAMVRRRIAAGGAPEPGRFIPVPFSLGNTTRPEENALLSTSSLL